MPIVKFTVLQRINIESHIRTQRGTDDEEMMLNYTLLTKVRIPKDEKSAYVREFSTPQGTMAEPIMKSIAVGPVEEIELETAEIRRLQAILKAAQISPEDIEWKHPLENQLRDMDTSGIAAVPKASKKSKEAVV